MGLGSKSLVSVEVIWDRKNYEHLEQGKMTSGSQRKSIKNKYQSLFWVWRWVGKPRDLCPHNISEFPQGIHQIFLNLFLETGRIHSLWQSSWMDAYVAEWMSITWHESTDKTKLPNRPSPYLHQWKYRLPDREKSVLIHLHNWHVIFHSRCLEKRHWQSMTHPEEGNRLNWKLKNHKEWEGSNLKSRRLAGGAGIIIEQLSSNILRIVPLECSVWFHWLSVFSKVIPWFTDRLGLELRFPQCWSLQHR